MHVNVDGPSTLIPTIKANMKNSKTGAQDTLDCWQTQLILQPHMQIHITDQDTEREENFYKLDNSTICVFGCACVRACLF